MAVPMKVAIYKGSELVGEETLDRDIIKIGRLASAHLRLDDNKVSRIHAVIEASSDGETYSIIDMGSSDGTFVNGERISKETLKDGDEVTVGEHRLVVAMKPATMDVADNAVVAEHQPPMAPPASDAPAAMAAAGAWTPDPHSQVTGAMAAGMVPGADAAGMVAGSSVPAMAGSPMPMSQDMMQAAWAQGAMAQQAAWQAGQAEAWQQAGWATGQQAYQHPNMPTDAYAQQAYDPNQMAAYAQQEAWAQHQHQQQWGPWGSVPNNLAAGNVPETDRSLEIKVIWQDSVLDTVTVHEQEVVTMGDEPQMTGFGPFKRFQKADIDVPSKGLPARTFPLAVSMSPTGASYKINIPTTFSGHLERTDGSYSALEELLSSGRGVESGDLPGTKGYSLNAEETLYLHHGALTLQMRYVRRQQFLAPPWTESLNYTWVNVLILTFFLHVLAVSVFIATPRTTEDLTEALFKNPNRFANYLLTPEKKQKNDSLLSKLKAGEVAAKAKGGEGKAGKKDYKEKKQGRMAVKGKPDDEEIAKSSLAKLLGAGAKGGASYLFGSGGLGGELKGALGGVTGAEIGDAAGLGGLGTRGTGPGGGGLSMNSVGLGALGTAGRGGGGDGSYGSGVGRLGKKVERDINISAGNPIIMGSLDKELIRRVINQHKAQIRYCYEKELVRSPGLFGKIGMVWTIQGDGSVRDASVKQSTMNNKGVESCIASKIRTWKFPKPKGGGVVIVNYPFVFKTSG